jgi:hypothetical protein
MAEQQLPGSETVEDSIWTPNQVEDLAFHLGFAL